MQLQAAIVPPPDVLEHALVAAQSIRVGPEKVPEEPQGGLLQRLARRGTTQAPVVDFAPSLISPEQQFVRLTRFGNVSNDDVETLGLALGVAAWDWPAPLVHVSALVLDASVPRPVISAQLGGDTDGLRVIFRKVLEVAQSQRFFLDRRIFHPEFTVATFDMIDDDAARERLVLETTALPGADWQVTHFSLMGLSFGDAANVFEEIAVVPLGGAG